MLNIYQSAYIFINIKSLIKMKKFYLWISLTVLAFATSATVTGQISDFSGTWKLDRAKSTQIDYFPTLVKLVIKVRSDTLYTERTYESGDGQEYPFTENVSLDGKEYKITIYDMPRVSKAVWLGSDSILSVESVTTFYGSNGSEDFKSREAWKLDNTNKVLTVNFTNNSSSGEISGAFVFNKAD
jgi:hypothetical protein